MNLNFEEGQKISNQQNKDSQPYNIQILLNFNSKNIVNNNIVPQEEELYKIRNKNLHLNRIKNQKNQKPFIFPSKTPQMTAGHLFRKKKDKKYDECQISNEKNEQKQKLISKVNSQSKNNKKHKSHTASMVQQHKPNKKMLKKTSLQFIQTPQFHQIHKSRQVKCKSVLQKKILDKNLRQTLLELMIKDYQKGTISAQNFKQAVSSLIDDEILKKGNQTFKTQIKSNTNNKSKIAKHSHTQNNNSVNTSCIRYSYTTSLKNTPKHKKPHSKSQKNYKLHKQQKKSSSYFKKYPQNKDDNDNDNNLQQQMTERVIQKKEFLNKIVIKGINSSLFLNSEHSDEIKSRSKYNSSKKQQPVQVFVLNTSDSVRQLKKQMMKISQINNNQQTQKLDETNQNFLQNRMALKIQKAWRCYKTKKLLYRIHAQIRYIDSINYRNLYQNSQNNQNQVRRTNSTNYTSNLLNSNQNQANFNSIRIVQNDSDVQNQQNQQQFIETQKYQNGYNDQSYQNEDENINENNDEEDNYNEEIQIFEKQSENLDNNEDQGGQDLDGPTESRILVFQKSPLFEEFQKNYSHEHQSDKQIEKFMSSQLIQNKRRSQLSLDKKLYKQKFDNIKNVQLQKWDQVMDYVKYFMENSQISKEQCLNNIVEYFQNQKRNVEDQLSISKSVFSKSSKKIIEFTNNNSKENEITQKKGQPSSDLLNNNKQILLKQKQQNNFLQPKKQKQKNIKSIKFSKNHLQVQQSQKQFQLSQQLSHCNSIVFINNTHTHTSNPNQEEIISCSQKSKELIKQLKTINVDCIQQTFRKRQKQLNDKRDKDIHFLTDRFINDKINTQQFQQQKDRLQKWFALQIRQLKKTRKIFQKSIKQAKQVLFRSGIDTQLQNKEFQKQFSQKQTKMIKCLSQSYLLNLKKQSSFSVSVSSSSVYYNNSQSQNNSNTSSQSQERQQIKKPKLIIKSNIIENKQINQPQQDNKIISNLKQTKNRDHEKRKKIKADLQIQKAQLQLLQLQKQLLIQKQSQSPQHQEEDSQQFYIQTNNNNNEEMLLSGKFLENHEIFSPVSSSQVKNESENYQNNQNQDESLTQQAESPKIIFNTFESNKNKKSVNLFQKSNQFQFNSSSSSNYKQKNQEISKEFDEYEMSNNESDQDITFGDNINEFNKLFKNLDIQDKQDIFQFMFLDLCLELFIQQQKNSKIIKSVQNYIKYLRKQRKTPKGIKTSYEVCRRYLAKFMVFIRDKNFQHLDRLECPMGPTAKQMLKYMRQSSSDGDDNESYSNSSQSLENINIILPIQIFEKYQSLVQNQLIVEPFYDNLQKQKQRILFLNSVFHIFNKAMFDSLNESLDHERPYGIWGKPFPWKKTLIIDRKFNQQTKENKLKKAIQKVVQNCSYLCGVMPDKEDSVFGNSKVSLQYVQRIREDRMSRMLSNDLLDNQDRWIFYDDQQTQILISISKHVTTLLIYEVLLDLKKIIL